MLRAVYWQRAYDPTSQERDAAVKAALLELGVEAQSFKGHLLFEPWTVQTKVGGFFQSLHADVEFCAGTRRACTFARTGHRACA